MPLIKNATIVIPTLNAEKRLGPILKRLTQAFDPEDIVVVDSSSQDGAPEIAKSFHCRLLTIAKKDFDHGRTRNLGAGAVKKELIIFMTDDALPESAETLVKLLSPFEDPSIAATYARQLPRPEADPLERFARVFNYPPEPRLQSKESLPQWGIKTFFCSDSCAAYRRTTFEALGKFPEPCPVSEDMYMAAKIILAGYKVRYTPEASVIHSHPLPLAKQFHRYFNIGRFFDREKWILKQAPLTSEGLRFLGAEARYLWEEGSFLSLPLVVSDAAARYLGLKLGMNHRHIPSWILPRLFPTLKN